MEQAWSKVGARLEKFVSSLEQVWIKFGASLETNWSELGASLSNCGSSLEQGLSKFGASLVQMLSMFGAGLEHLLTMFETSFLGTRPMPIGFIFVPIGHKVVPNMVHSPVKTIKQI